MSKDITILPHHLDVVISKYYFSDEWEDMLRGVEEQHGKQMVVYAQGVVKDFFDSSMVKVTIERPDSICSPKLSQVCKRCMTSYCIDSYHHPPTIMDLVNDKADYKKYQLRRIGKDDDYRKVRHIVLNLDEVTHLFYYGLEPKKYSPKFLIGKIEKTARKLGKGSSSAYRPSQVGYSHHKSIAEDFPDVYRLMESSLVKDFIDRTISEYLDKRKLTGEELNDLRKKYYNLFATIGSDSFYYEILKIIGK